MRKLRILHVVESFSGGVFGALQTMVNGMAEDCEIYILHNVRNETPKDYKETFHPGIRFIRAKHLVREINPIEDAAAIREVRKAFREIQPDVAHLHSSKAGAIGRLALNGKKVPVFYSPQGYSFLMDEISEEKRKFYYALEKLLGTRPSMTVASCDGEYQMANRVSRRATFINNGINTRELDQFGLDIEKRPQRLCICTLGRIVPQKNPELFNEIAKRFPDVRFLWIGDGELRDKLTSPNIEIAGWLPKREALRRMMDASVFILTSFYEGLAFSIMEAMYLKRVCIVSKIPGNVDAIQDHKTGYVCGALEDYVSAIDELMAHGIDEGMLSAARQRIVDELNQEVMSRKYEQLYQAEIRRIRGGALLTSWRKPSVIFPAVFAQPCAVSVRGAA